MIREAEVILIDSNYKFVSEKNYDVGMLLIRYSK